MVVKTLINLSIDISSLKICVVLRCVDARGDNIGMAWTLINNKQLEGAVEIVDGD